MQVVVRWKIHLLFYKIFWDPKQRYHRISKENDFCQQIDVFKRQFGAKARKLRISY